ncbi:hypothetical protein TL16_g09417 [Triparma laevis f. inornata]|uniref:SRCR domain-containing protein n=1 Tax=Triparma laevis f. inornata TaxID=1714386 RepID=A0A9W7EM59_9STRA|nr:hypothetical protein TL16_g09417 [Triparma laevis f. inornata]
MVNRETVDDSGGGALGKKACITHVAVAHRSAGNFGSSKRDHTGGQIQAEELPARRVGARQNFKQVTSSATAISNDAREQAVEKQTQVLTVRTHVGIHHFSVLVLALGIHIASSYTTCEPGTGATIATGQVQDSYARLRGANGLALTLSAEDNGIAQGRAEYEGTSWGGRNYWATSGSIYTIGWNSFEAGLFCEELAGANGWVVVEGTPLSVDNTPQGVDTAWKFECYGTENKLRDCKYDFYEYSQSSFSREDVGARCKFVKCEQCEAGKYNDNNDASTPCKECPAGRWSSGVGMSSCNLCPEGKASQSIGQLSDGSHVRLRDNHNEAPSFVYGSVTGRLEVIPEGETKWGTIARDGWDDENALVACRQLGAEVGLILFNNTASGVPNYEVNDGNGEIWWWEVECDGNEETLAYCPKKSYTQDSKHYLDIGITCLFRSADTCKACPAGKYSDVYGKNVCTNCEVGKYYGGPAGAETADMCEDCEAGKAAPVPGLASCESCIGSYSNGTAKCEPCPAGKYSNETDAKTADTCKLCEAGKAGKDGARSCKSCAAGTYSADDGAGECENCIAGTFSTEVEATSDSTCTMCREGTSTSGNSGASGCSRCWLSLTSEDRATCLHRRCEDHEYNNGGKCEKCSYFASALLLLMSLLSFLLVAWHAEIIATDRKKMIRLRVISTFFQTSELTTLIQLSWPKFLFFTLPFQFPMSDVKCLAATSGWTANHTFYAYIYGPLLFFAFMGLRAFSLGPKRKTKKRRILETLVVLMTLWYSPLLQTVGSMYECFEDPERDYMLFLVSDPTLSCTRIFEGNIFAYGPRDVGRLLVHIHSGICVMVVGIGFPLVTFIQIKRLQVNGKLDAMSSWAALYQFYTTKFPYFESVQLLRKGALIFVLKVRENPTFEAIVLIIINACFLAILIRSRPMVYFPSSLLGNRNLFHLAEVSGAAACLFGNVLAFLATFDQHLVDTLGISLALLNIIFATLFLVGYNTELRKSKKIEKEKGKLSTSSDDREFVYSLKEWGYMQSALVGIEGESIKRRRELLDGLPFIHSRIVLAITTDLSQREISKQEYTNYNPSREKVKVRNCKERSEELGIRQLRSLFAGASSFSLNAQSAIIAT